VPHRGVSLDMYWEYQTTLTGATTIDAVDSEDGLTAIVGLTEPGTTGPNFTLVDLFGGTNSAMAIDPALSGKAVSIDIVNSAEAYAVVNGTSPFSSTLGGGGGSISRILCWDGTQWTARGQPSIASGEGGLISVVVDPTHSPATVFAATSSKIYISRDSARTWVRASNGLPQAVQCKGLACVRDGSASHVYMATYGRSIWGISSKERWQ
jgi:hypothetical protein